MSGSQHGYFKLSTDSKTISDEIEHNLFIYEKANAWVYKYNLGNKQNVPIAQQGGGFFPKNANYFLSDEDFFNETFYLADQLQYPNKNEIKKAGNDDIVEKFKKVVDEKRNTLYQWFQKNLFGENLAKIKSPAENDRDYAQILNRTPFGCVLM